MTTPAGSATAHRVDPFVGDLVSYDAGLPRSVRNQDGDLQTYTQCRGEQAYAVAQVSHALALDDEANDDAHKKFVLGRAWSASDLASSVSAFSMHYQRFLATPRESTALKQLSDRALAIRDRMEAVSVSMQRSMTYEQRAHLKVKVQTILQTNRTELKGILVRAMQVNGTIDDRACRTGEGFVVIIAQKYYRRARHSEFNSEHHLAGALRYAMALRDFAKNRPLADAPLSDDQRRELNKLRDQSGEMIELLSNGAQCCAAMDPKERAAKLAAFEHRLPELEAAFTRTRPTETLPTD